MSSVSSEGAIDIASRTASDLLMPVVSASLRVAMDSRRREVPTSSEA